MEKEYNVGTWLTPSDEYIKDIKLTLVEKGVATELTPNEEIPVYVETVVKQMDDVKQALIDKGVVDEEMRDSELGEIVENISYLRTLLDASKTTNYLFAYSEVSDIKSLIRYNDTSNVTNMGNMFEYCANLKEVPPLDTSNVTVMNGMFNQCTSLEKIPQLDTSKVNQLTQIFQNCNKLETIYLTDVGNVNNFQTAFSYCINLKNLYLHNIKANLTIGSGNTWGHLLTTESLIYICKECVRTNFSRKLTMGSTNIAKLADVYVRFVDRTQTEIAVGEKGDIVVCEADNNDAMTITEYMALKNWTLA